MDKLVRCTVCTWRGSFSDAEQAPRVRPSQIPPPMVELQQAYEEVHALQEQTGAPKPPPCPSCGHHITNVHKRKSSLHP